jgi:hypothetical protein
MGCLLGPVVTAWPRSAACWPTLASCHTPCTHRHSGRLHSTLRETGSRQVAIGRVRPEIRQHLRTPAGIWQRCFLSVAAPDRSVLLAQPGTPASRTGLTRGTLCRSSQGHVT